MKLRNYFSTFEKLLWLFSFAAVVCSFLMFDRENWINLIASVLGATFLIFLAKGNPIGQFLTIVFSILYAIISYSYAYYGEMITYLGMTAPMALLALIAWLRHPFQGNKAEVEVNSISKKETVFMFALTAVVTVVFYFILSALGNANIIPSTISVTTSFLASYLTFRRNRYYALAYAANDLVLIVLWTLATMTDTHYVPVLVNFIVFAFNDLYGFINWTRMKKKQALVTDPRHHTL